MVIPILPFGFLQLIVNVYSDQISAWKEEDKRRYGTHKLNFLIEVYIHPILDNRIHGFAYSVRHI